MKIPVKEIDILAHVYRIKIVPEMSEDELGRCDTKQCLISIAPNLPPDVLKDTVLHEIRHAVHWLVGLDDKSTEESHTSRGTTALRATLAAEPELTAWLFSR